MTITSCSFHGCFLTPHVDVNISSTLALWWLMAHGRCVSHHLPLLSLSPCYHDQVMSGSDIIIIFTAQCHGHQEAEHGHNIQWHRGYQAPRRPVSEVSQIFTDKLFPELSQFPRVYQDIPCKSAFTPVLKPKSDCMNCTKVLSMDSFCSWAI